MSKSPVVNYSALQEHLEIDSPSGFTYDACEYIVKFLRDLGYQPELTNKGAVRCQFGDNPKLAIAAHVDTLGAIVSGINSNGTLSFSPLGGLSLTGAEGEYVRIRTLDETTYTGTILLNDPSSHTNRNRETTDRNLTNMHIRLDEEVYNRDQVEHLGISIGDIICLDVNYQELPSGFIKSRFLDNKAGCFVLMELAKTYVGKNVPVDIFFSNYEEVGHGGTCGYSDTVSDLLVIDMGVLGNACQGNEVSCSICAKDSTGPYDYRMRQNLVRLAKAKNIPFIQDVYPFYGSDGSAALSAGNDMRVGLIGPGVAASHSTERTHKKGIEATTALCEAFIEDQFSA